MSDNVVVGIDFGTAGIGYAFSFDSQPNNIIESDFIGQGFGKKIPTEIILTPDSKYVLAFGEECKDYIKKAEDKKINENNDNINHDDVEYEYYKDIKMNLYKKEYKIKSTKGKEEDIEIIITKLLEKVAENALSQIRDVYNNHSIVKKNVKWVLTVPAIWEEKSKQIMINASIKAGLIDENNDKSLFLALEPEVASIYYIKKLLNQKNKEFDYISQGNPYIICDIGAGTVDICTHRRVIENNENLELIEEYPPIGGDFGGSKINEEFINRLIVPLFGEENVNKLKYNIANWKNWNNLEEEIEKAKRSCSSNISHNVSQFTRLDCHMFDDDDCDEPLDYFISEYNKKDLKHKYKLRKEKPLKKKNWVLEFDSNIFYDIMKELAQKIVSKLEEIYKSVHTNFIIFTGAGSNNATLINYIQCFAREKNIFFTYKIILYPETTIMKGAVLFGFQREIIRKRKAKYTLGIQINSKWEDKYQEHGKRNFLQCQNDYYCTNLFSKFITINQYIEFNDIIRKYYIALDKKTNIAFFKTNRDNCTYTDEKDENGNLIIHEFGSVIFNIDEDYDRNQKDIVIEMKLGGTYIDVNAIYVKTGKRLNVIQNFC